MDNNNRIDETAVLRRELQRARREIASLNGIIQRNSVSTDAKVRLSNVISAEKSKQEKYMNLLLEHSPDIIMIFDHDGRFVYCTDSFLKLSNIANFGLINGHSYMDVIERYASGSGLEALDACRDESVINKQMQAIPDAVIDIGLRGDPRHYNVYITPMLDEDKNPEGSLILLHDMTEILGAKLQAEHANRVKSDFLATVSHEIRTPLNAIIGITDMLRKTALDERQHGFAQNIKNSSKVLLGLINDILDFSKIEAGKLELVNDYFDLRELLNQLDSMFSVMFTQKGLDFICHFSPDIPDVIFGDEGRLRQIISNIVNNALKYTESGKVVLRVVSTREDTLKIDVEDTGIGIKKEDIARLFTAFEQLDLVRNKNITGTGLGLAITRSLCSLMGGKISAESEYGVGSCFIVEVPIKVGTYADLKQSNEIVEEFRAPEARVLIVDDIEINLMVASAMLEDYGIVADEASSGKEALRLASENAYDIIFMDHMMPEMDGVETTEHLRAMGGRMADLPVIALTANVISDAVKMFFANGFQGFIPKPISAEKLSACLLEWLPPHLVKRKKG